MHRDSRHYTVCQIIREIYHETDNPVTRQKCRIAHTMTKHMIDEICRHVGAAVTGLQRVSRPGRRVYTKRQDIPLVLSGMGIAVVSTPRGVMTGKKAYRLGLGGEVLCYVW